MAIYSKRLLLFVTLALSATVIHTSAASAAAFVQLQNGRLTLDGKPFVAKGVNYMGSWRHKTVFNFEPSIEGWTNFSFLHNFDLAAIDADFAFMHESMGVTAVRVGLPAEEDYANLVRYHGYLPFCDPLGNIDPVYLERLRLMADIGLKHGIRIHLAGMWSMGPLVGGNPAPFRPGTERDLFYGRYFRGLARALKDHPGIMAYEIGNETMVNWAVNGEHRSQWEAEVLSFAARRIHDVREEAPHQLVTSGEIGHDLNQREKWFWPSPEFAVLEDIHGVNGGVPFNLASLVDYISPHFYLVPLRISDTVESFEARLPFAQQSLQEYLQFALAQGKAVVAGEFGMQLEGADRAQFLSRDQWQIQQGKLFSALLTTAEKAGMSGALAWAGLPSFRLIPGQYFISPSTFNPYSPTEILLTTDGIYKTIIGYDAVFETYEWTAAGQIVLNAAGGALQAAWNQPPAPNPVPTPAPTPNPPPMESGPPSRLEAVTFQELQSVVSGCGPDRVKSLGCAYAAAQACLRRNLETGFGPVESDHEGGYLTCLNRSSSAVFVVTYTELQTHHEGCWPNEMLTGQCNAAARRYCVSRGYGSGFQNVDRGDGAAEISCVASNVTELRLVTFEELSRYHESCTGDHSISGPCAAAIRRYCVDQNFAGGFGPVEGDSTAAYVSCLK